jgi:hypothetical protein
LNPFVIHHYRPPLWPETLKVENLEAGAQVVSAMWRQDAPALYVEKPLVETLKRSTLEAFTVATGQDFQLPGGYRFIGTVTPDNFFFFHVYARLA